MALPSCSGSERTLACSFIVFSSRTTSPNPSSGDFDGELNVIGMAFWPAFLIGSTGAATVFRRRTSCQADFSLFLSAPLPPLSPGADEGPAGCQGWLGLDTRLVGVGPSLGGKRGCGNASAVDSEGLRARLVEAVSVRTTATDGWFLDPGQRQEQLSQALQIPVPCRVRGLLQGTASRPSGLPVSCPLNRCTKRWARNLLASSRCTMLGRRPVLSA